jgi:hypothetical protein
MLVGLHSGDSTVHACCTVVDVVAQRAHVDKCMRRLPLVPNYTTLCVTVLQCAQWRSGIVRYDCTHIVCLCVHVHCLTNMLGIQADGEGRLMEGSIANIAIVDACGVLRTPK